MTNMLRALVQATTQFFEGLRQSFFSTLPLVGPQRTNKAAYNGSFAPYQRLLLTDGVGRTLFEQFAHHRLEENREEETGWILLGHREPTEAIALATLPAGARADAGIAHVRFNCEAQALASSILRMRHKRLTILGVVHTHPGSLRHPSEGDFRGDCQWVKQLRGGEGVFGIGTADVKPSTDGLIAYQPRPNVQCWGEFQFSWYSLRQGDTKYRPLAVELTHGPDLAADLHKVWSALEAHSERLGRLQKQQLGMQFDVIHMGATPALVCTLPLADNQQAIKIAIREKELHYYLVRGGDLLEVDLQEIHVDRGVYLLLAELAK